VGLVSVCWCECSYVIMVIKNALQTPFVLSSYFIVKYLLDFRICTKPKTKLAHLHEVQVLLPTLPSTEILVPLPNYDYFVINRAVCSLVSVCQPSNCYQLTMLMRPEMSRGNCAKKRTILLQKVLNVKYPLKSGRWECVGAV